MKPLLFLLLLVSICVSDLISVLDYFKPPTCTADNYPIPPSYNLFCSGGSFNPQCGYSGTCTNSAVKARLISFGVTDTYTIEFDYNIPSSEEPSSFDIYIYSLHIHVINFYQIQTFIIRNYRDCSVLETLLNYGTAFLSSETAKFVFSSSGISFYINDVFKTSTTNIATISYTCPSDPYDKFKFVSPGEGTINNFIMTLEVVPITCYNISSSDSNVCSGNGICSSQDNCTCDVGYYGDQCQNWDCNEINKDNPSVCSSHGDCVSPDICVCTGGYTGSDCETAPIITCFGLTDPEACNGDKGTCVSTDTCSCVTGYLPPECEDWNCYGKNKDDPEVCSDHGTCVSPDNCICDENWWKQPDCSELISCNGKSVADPDVCSGHGDCVAQDSCRCDILSQNGITDYYYGADCDSVTTNCTKAVEFWEGKYEICSVEKDLYFNNWKSCENETCPEPPPECPGCQHGTCPSDGVCQPCLPGWTGTNCDEPICDPPCVNGNCEAPGKCICTGNYYGSFCNISDTVFTHVCPPDPPTWSCFGRDKDDSLVCRGNGFCRPNGQCSCYRTSFVPDCTPAFSSGITCHGVDQQCGSMFNWGTCPSETSFCDCNTGYSGTFCQEWLCYGVTRENPKVCSGHGYCFGPNDCQHCPPEYFGNSCENWRCFGTLKNDFGVCSEHGTCESHNYCKCKCGWEGDQCDQEVPIDGEPCDLKECFGFPETNHTHACSGHGDCISNNTCDCDDTWDGEQCDRRANCFGYASNQIGSCGPAWPVSRGVCIKDDVCECFCGWEGNYCQHLDWENKQECLKHKPKKGRHWKRWKHDD